jgi:hypothetical protein
MSTPNTCTLIGSDKGGVGKSFVAQLIVQAYDRIGRPLTVVEIDHQRKLTSIFGPRVNLSIAASPPIASSRTDRHAAESFFNPVYESWTNGESITDLGANVTTPLMEWARVHDIATLAIEEQVHFRFVAMATPDDQSLRSAALAIQDARRSLGEPAEIFLVLNVITDGAGFKPYAETEEWKHLMRLVHSHRVTVCNVPLCDSSLLEHGRSQGFTVIDILKNGNNELARLGEVTGLDRISLRTQFNRLGKWVREFQDELRPLLVPRKAMPSFQQAAE